MKTKEQQICLMHQRAEELCRSRERLILSLGAFVSVGLIAGILRLMFGLSGTPYRPVEDAYTAASLLEESFGGYIFTAVLAFMAGSAITVFCVKYKEHTASDQNSEIGTEIILDPEKHTKQKLNGGEDGISR